eukprot:3720706-Rhodomonas_salina.1
MFFLTAGTVSVTRVSYASVQFSSFKVDTGLTGGSLVTRAFKFLAIDDDSILVTESTALRSRERGLCGPCCQCCSSAGTPSVTSFFASRRESRLTKYLNDWLNAEDQLLLCPATPSESVTSVGLCKAELASGKSMMGPTAAVSASVLAVLALLAVRCTSPLQPAAAGLADSDGGLLARARAPPLAVCARLLEIDEWKLTFIFVPQPGRRP